MANGEKSLDGRRVLLLHPHMVMPGGALNYLVKLAEQLQAHGATVGILTLQAECGKYSLNDSVELLDLNGPLTSSLSYWLFFPFWQGKTNRWIQQWNPDVLVPQVFPANWWAWIYKWRQKHVPIAWICHEPSAFIHSKAWIRALNPRWKSFLAKILQPVLAKVDVSLVRYSDRNIANSRFTSAEFKRVYGFSADAVAYPGIDFQSFECPGGHKEKEIVTVARLTKFKRIDFLIKVFSEVLKVRPDLTYHIVGTGEEAFALQARAKQLGVESQIIFHGAVSDEKVRELCRRSSLFLHGSVDEPFGMAPLEAIACGTPVVAHRSGGPAEFVTAACGRLIDSLEAADWAREIAAYLELIRDDPELLARVRECARRFDWPATLRPAVEVIAGLCGTESR